MGNENMADGAETEAIWNGACWKQNVNLISIMIHGTEAWTLQLFDKVLSYFSVCIFPPKNWAEL